MEEYKHFYVKKSSPINKHWVVLKKLSQCW